MLFNIYKDDEFYAYTTDVVYEDHETDIAVEYCYFVKAVYDGIGESPATNTSCQEWDVYPPSDIVAEDGDGYVDLTWDLPVGGEEVFIQYDDGILANAFYFFQSYDEGMAHGMRFDTGTDFDVMAASVKILSEGDEFWPWPDAEHVPLRILLFNDIGGMPGDLLYEEEAIAEDGWATIYPNYKSRSTMSF